jgi:hypothetical protein
VHFRGGSIAGVTVIAQQDAASRSPEDECRIEAGRAAAHDYSVETRLDRGVHVAVYSRRALLLNINK